MASYKQFMRYVPPDFRIFKEYGYGFLHTAYFATRRAKSAYVNMRLKLLDDPERGAKPIGFPEPDIVSMYAEWTLADDLLKRLDCMDPSEREKHLKLDENQKDNRTFETVTEKHADLYGRIIAWEEKHGERELYPALDRQLKRRLDTWERLLEVAKVMDLDDPGEPFEGVDDYCHERTILEYAAIGIGTAQIRDPKRLRPLPYFTQFAHRRSASDVLFRKLLKGRYQHAPWAEPDVFWWHHPPKK